MGQQASKSLNRHHDLGKNADEDEINLEVFEKI